MEDSRERDLTGMTQGLMNQSSTRIASMIFRIAQVYALAVAKPAFGIFLNFKCVLILLERVVYVEV